MVKQPQQPVSILQTGASKAKQTNGAKGVTFQLPCLHQLMHDLQVVNLSGAVCAPCRKTACDFEHVNIRASSKKALHGVVDRLSSPRDDGRAPLLKKDLADQAHKQITDL
jgi:hypothetical protein